ncbi:hypothetical protein CROQUDRAFT_110823 [Cronartium quercuum f. sp. fusiforme G11]|uniref:Uncharacterized protein n=1 Tax=Cronartium quercuum f. sp. fusiforme G11 TaxID=708437 RepID=A0A9P6N6Y2_9BASI|nr:hypothetical protein CROQUDRAFT_110823 [Cronartium quercuum f. sp. fusiforme G11]
MHEVLGKQDIMVLAAQQLDEVNGNTSTKSHSQATHHHQNFLMIFIAKPVSAIEPAHGVSSL